jgi:pyruvate/2-oxoglutarate dehydrogenase complex dihydrolipoamide dehydrogenase (E3) component
LEVVHVAITQGEATARNAASLLGRREGAAAVGDPGPALFAVFSEPQCAVAGMGEAALRRAGVDFATAVYPFDDHGKSLVMGETAGLVKLIAERGTGKLLGGAVVGPEAAELIHEVVVALSCGMTAAGLAAVPHYHPTLSEIWTYPAEELADVC